MHIPQPIANSMLQNISDPRLREMYGGILSGKHALKVYCLAPRKNPRNGKPYHASPCLIGFITKRGQVIDNQTIEKQTGEPIAGIESSRDRFDGRKGFRCYCGNWSIQAPEEQGILDQSVAPQAPTQEQMLAIFAKTKDKPKLQFIGGVAEYDGFRLEEVQA